MRTYAGVWGDGTLEQDNLTANLLKTPEISKVLTYQFKQYSLTYLSEALGRVTGNKQNFIGNEKFKWKVMGYLDRPSTMVGLVGSGVGLGNTSFQLEIEDSYFNPNDLVRFSSGTQAIVIGLPTSNGANYVYTFVLQTDDTTATIPAGDYAAGTTAYAIGSVHPEASERGWDNDQFPDEHTNWLFKHRMSCEITGDAMTDITWIENNGSRLWYWTKEQHMRMRFIHKLELMRWYSTRTMDTNEEARVFDSFNDGKALVAGDGVLAQIDSGNYDQYTTLSEDYLNEWITWLATRSSWNTNNHWLVFTGSAGALEFHNALQPLITQGSYVYDMGGDGYIDIGVDFNTYRILDNRMTIVKTAIFDDKRIHPNIDPDTGHPYESSRFVFLNFAAEDGESNIEVFAKGAEGHSRDIMMKYITGMFNPFEPASMFASNQKDAFESAIMTHSGIGVRDALSCGQLVKVAS